jgi:hypothetical protein
MVTWTEGADDSALDYHQKALEHLEEIKKTILESKRKLLEKLLPLYNPVLGQQWWDALKKMDIRYSRKLIIEKLGQIARSSVDGDEMARWIEIWLKPNLEHRALDSHRRRICKERSCWSSSLQRELTSTKYIS